MSSNPKRALSRALGRVFRVTQKQKHTQTHTDYGREMPLSEPFCFAVACVKVLVGNYSV